jgi:hypothetical protein
MRAIAPRILISALDGGVASFTPRPFSPGQRDPGIHLKYEVGWAPQPVWTQKRKIRVLPENSPDCSASSPALTLTAIPALALHRQLSQPLHCTDSYPSPNTGSYPALALTAIPALALHWQLFSPCTDSHPSPCTALTAILALALTAIQPLHWQLPQPLHCTDSYPSLNNGSYPALALTAIPAPKLTAIPALTLAAMPAQIIPALTLAAMPAQTIPALTLTAIPAQVTLRYVFEKYAVFDKQLGADGCTCWFMNE